MFTLSPYLVTAGDHPPGDGLTRFQTVFAGASSADVSSYAIGSGINDEGVLTNGQIEFVMDSNVNAKNIVWDDASMRLSSDTEPMTYEFLFTAAEKDHVLPNSIKFGQFTTHALVGIDMRVAAWPNYNDANIAQAGYTTEVFTFADLYAGVHHIALINRATGLQDFYINGTRVITGRDVLEARAATGTFQMAGIGRGETYFRYLGGRVRNAEMYPDAASFTPPSSVAAWGPP